VKVQNPLPGFWRRVARTILRVVSLSRIRSMVAGEAAERIQPRFFGRAVACE
jgi:hypothetical protein